jgi:hypothetical protein
MGDEKRKSKRIPIRLELTISELFKQDYLIIPNINESIEVIDISKSGVGFYCKDELPINYYFDAKIQLPNKHFLSVIKIIRATKLENGYRIGCEFVGLGDILSKCVDEYDLELQGK